MKGKSDQKQCGGGNCQWSMRVGATLECWCDVDVSRDSGGLAERSCCQKVVVGHDGLKNLYRDCCVGQDTIV